MIGVSKLYCGAVHVQGHNRPKRLCSPIEKARGRFPGAGFQIPARCQNALDLPDASSSPEARRWGGGTKPHAGNPVVTRIDRGTEISSLGQILAMEFFCDL